MVVTESNYLELFPLLDFSKLTKDEYYDCSNLNSFLLTNVDYQLISKRKDNVLKLINNKKLILIQERVRLDMNINNPQIVSLISCLGSELKIGDILPTGRTCKTGLPVYFTLDRIEKGYNNNYYIMGKENGMIEYNPTKWYCIGKII